MGRIDANERTRIRDKISLFLLKIEYNILLRIILSEREREMKRETEFFFIILLRHVRILVRLTYTYAIGPGPVHHLHIVSTQPIQPRGPG